MKKRGYPLFSPRGNIFGENIISRSTRPKQSRQFDSPRWVFALVLVLVFSFLGIARLVDLQIIRGSYFRSLADGNRVRRVPIRASRGDIVDRQGKSLARNIPIYRLAEFSSGGVVVKSEKISRDEALRIQSQDPEKAARLTVDIEREYPLSEAAAHVVGYVGEATAEEIEKTSDVLCPASVGGQEGQRLLIFGSLVGRTGMEAYYDCFLRGTDGEELIEVDTRGHLVRKLGVRPAIPGQTLKLSVDAGLQKAAFEALQNAPDEEGTSTIVAEGGVVRGAVVGADPGSGAILALVSAPSFNPASIAEDYGKIATDPNLPLFNRAIGGAYHPGSTFKIVTATAGLEDGKITSDFEYKDTGVLRVGSFSYSNWYFTQYGRTEGLVTVARSLTRSTDTFFYKLGEMVGPERLSFWADKFGYGRETGIDLAGETGALLPSPEWKLKFKKERWFLGNTYHMAIGQGDLTATPLQVNMMTGVVANGGKLCVPRVAERGEGGCAEIGVKQGTLKTIQEGMHGACSTGGTAYPFFDWNLGSRGLPVSCKTGTAQTVGDKKTHAWFTVFGPVGAVANESESERTKANQDGRISPNIVVTVLVEEGGEGSRVAAPVAKNILSVWFGGEVN